MSFLEPCGTPAKKFSLREILAYVLADRGGSRAPVSIRGLDSTGPDARPLTAPDASL